MNRLRIISLFTMLFFFSVHTQPDDQSDEKAWHDGTTWIASLVTPSQLEPKQIYPESLSIHQSLQQQPMNSYKYKQACQALVAQEVHDRQNYRMSYRETENMMRLDYDDFVGKLLKDSRFDVQTIQALWSDYLDRYSFKRASKVKGYSQKIDDELRRREEQKRLAFVAQYEKNQKIDQIKHLGLMYQIDFQDDGKSQQANDRAHARQCAQEQTRQESFVQFHTMYQLTPQAQAYLRLHDLNPDEYTQLYGTTLQQQFHREVSEIFEQAAIIAKEIPVRSQFLEIATLCADQAYQANKQECLQLVASLTNVSFGLLELTKSHRQAVAHGVFASVKDLLYTITHPIETVQSVSKAVYFLLETIALNSYSEEFGFEDLYISLRDQRNAQIIAGLKSFGHAIVASSTEQKIEALARFGTDFVVPGKMLQVLGGALGIVRNEIKVAQAIERFAAATVGDQSVVYEVFCKSEMIAQESIATQVADTLIDAEKQFVKNMQSTAIKNGRTSNHKPKEIDTRRLLEKNLEIAENAKIDAVRIETLHDGRIRYYDAETPCSNPGPTRGSGYVTEYDPYRGIVRGWYASYTHEGKINRVHPKMINGKNINSLHYPHTKKELEFIALHKKGKK